MLATGVVTVLKANVGVGPVDALLSGFASVAGIAHGTAGLAFSATLIAVAVMTRCQVQIGTVAGSAMLGPLINLIIGANIISPGETMVARLTVFAFGVLSIAFGVAFVINAGLGTGVLELLSGRLAGKVPLSGPATRTVLEMLFVLTGAALGGQVGVGTLVFALTFGYLLEGAIKVTGWLRSTEINPQLQRKLRRRTSRRM